MSEPVTDKVALRIRDRLETGKPGGLRRSYEVIDEQTQESRVTCELIGNVASKSQALTDNSGRSWTLAPNRKVLPSKWTLTDDANGAEWEFRQKALGALVNPFQKALMSVASSDGRVSLQLVDLHGSKLPVVLGLESGKYALMQGDEPLATLTRLPTKKPSEARGLFGKFKRFMAGSDIALVSVSDTHPLPAEAVLAMYFLYKEFTDVSAA